MISEFGYDGIEFVCWGDYFEVDKVNVDDGYCVSKWELFECNNL